MLKLSFLCFKNFSKTFSTESAQKPTICDLLFLIAIFSSRNDNKYLSEMRNKYHSSYFTITEVFPGLGPILTTVLTILTANFSKHFFVYKLPYENKNQSSTK